MDLSEIRLHVAQFLGHRDTLSCALVCRDWYQSFISYIWHIGCFDLETIQKRPPPEAMIANGHFIRILIMQTVDRVDEYLQYCPNIEKIYFLFGREALSRFARLKCDDDNGDISRWNSSGNSQGSNHATATTRDDEEATETRVIKDMFWEPLTRLVLKCTRVKSLYFGRHTPTPSSLFLESLSMQKRDYPAQKQLEVEDAGKKEKEEEEDEEQMNNLFDASKYRTFDDVVFSGQEFESAQVPWLMVFVSRCKEITFDDTNHDLSQQHLSQNQQVATAPLLSPPSPLGMDNWIFPLTTALTFERVKGVNALDQIHWISCMPALKRLEFSLDDQIPVTEIVQLFCEMLTNQLAQLEELFFTATPSQSLSEAMQVKVIEAPQRPIKKLRLTGFDFGRAPEVLLSTTSPVVDNDTHSPFHASLAKSTTFERMMARFALSLTALDLHKSFHVSSRHSQTILTSCPNLEYCSLLGLHIRDMFDTFSVDVKWEGGEGTSQDGSRPGQNRASRLERASSSSSNSSSISNLSDGNEWICLKMKELSLFICGLTDAGPKVNRKVFTQIGRLTQLRKLNVGTSGGLRFEEMARNSAWRRDGLNCRVTPKGEGGLDELATLRDLQEFSMVGLEQHLEIEDVQWMVRHWPKLTKVKKSRQSSDADMAQLVDFLNKANVQALGSW
ncbi:hypothetical protein BG004_006277 [Podila humilis]|nr:hypothetical protein BG004_006277 [Podila humilis]